MEIEDRTYKGLEGCRRAWRNACVDSGLHLDVAVCSGFPVQTTVPSSLGTRPTMKMAE